MNEVISTGIPKLDALMGGGIPTGTITLLKGTCGTGKSTLGVQFLVEGARKGQKGILVIAEQDRRSVLNNFATLGLSELIETKEILLVDFSRLRSLTKKDLSGKFALQLFEDLEIEEAQLLVLDSIQSFVLTVLEETTERVRDLIFQLADRCRSVGITSLFISEEGTYDDLGIEDFILDNVIRLAKRHLGDWEHKTVQVAKVRGQKHDHGIHGAIITSKGLDIVHSYQIDPEVTKISNSAHFGIPSLDKLLNGGIKRGSFFLLEVDSHATHWQPILGAWHAHVKDSKEGTIAVPGSSIATKEVTNILETSDDLQITFIDAYGRKKAQLDNRSEDGWFVFRADTGDQIVEMIDIAATQASKAGYKPFRIHMNMSDLAGFIGEESALSAIPKAIELLRNFDNCLIGICTPELHTPSYIESLRYFSSGIIKLWVDRGLELLQVTKHPIGSISRPYIVRRISEKPFLELL